MTERQNTSIGRGRRAVWHRLSTTALALAIVIGGCAVTTAHAEIGPESGCRAGTTVELGAGKMQPAVPLAVAAEGTDAFRLGVSAVLPPSVIRPALPTLLAEEHPSRAPPACS
jgi:hypothetical protein